MPPQAMCLVLAMTWVSTLSLPEGFPTGYENTLGTVFTLGMRQNLPRGAGVELLCLVTDCLGTQR